MKQDGTLAKIHEKWFGAKAEPNSTTVKVMEMPEALTSNSQPSVRQPIAGRSACRTNVESADPSMSIFDTFLNWKVFVQTLPLAPVGPDDHARPWESRPSSWASSAGWCSRWSGSTALRRFGRSPSPISTSSAPSRSWFCSSSSTTRCPSSGMRLSAVRGRRLRAEPRFRRLFGRDFPRRHRGCAARASSRPPTRWA